MELLWSIQAFFLIKQWKFGQQTSKTLTELPCNIENFVEKVSFSGKLTFWHDNILANSSKRISIEPLLAYSQSIRPRKTFNSQYSALDIFWRYFINRTVDCYCLRSDFFRQYFSKTHKNSRDNSLKSHILHNNLTIENCPKWKFLEFILKKKKIREMDKL